MIKEKTLAESMALAVLKDDLVTAYALADMLQEQRAHPNSAYEEAARMHHENTPPAYDGYQVYRWPEFQAFCKRAGILWDLRTISITFKIEEGSRLVIDQRYAAHDAGDQPHGQV